MKQTCKHGHHGAEPSACQSCLLALLSKERARVAELLSKVDALVVAGKNADWKRADALLEEIQESAGSAFLRRLEAAERALVQIQDAYESGNDSASAEEIGDSLEGWHAARAEKSKSARAGRV